MSDNAETMLYTTRVSPQTKRRLDVLMMTAIAVLLVVLFIWQGWVYTHGLWIPGPGSP